MILAMLAGLGMIGLAIVRTIRRARVTQLLWSGPWEQVRVDVQPAGERIAFHFADGSSWRSAAGQRWPSWKPHHSDRTGSSPTDLEPDDVPTDELVWWVADGTRAVFSPTMGTPLVLVRRRQRQPAELGPPPEREPSGASERSVGGRGAAGDAGTGGSDVPVPHDMRIPTGSTP
jgi:hypothetical protein